MNTTAVRTGSPKQIKFATDLYVEYRKLIQETDRFKNAGAEVQGLLLSAIDERLAELGEWPATKIRTQIDQLITQVRQMRAVVREATAPAKLEPGIYENELGIFQVKPNRAGTHMYAKKVVEFTGERLTESDEIVNIEFEYAPGAIYKIQPEHKMSIERGKALTLRYGKCMCCGRKLKAATSVERGIGPICIKFFS
jgi:hypothetical protein